MHMLKSILEEKNEMFFTSAYVLNDGDLVVFDFNLKIRSTGN